MHLFLLKSLPFYYGWRTCGLRHYVFGEPLVDHRPNFIGLDLVSLKKTLHANHTRGRHHWTS